MRNKEIIFIKKYKLIDIYAKLISEEKYYCYTTDDKYLPIEEKNKGILQEINKEEIEFLQDLENKLNKKFIDFIPAEYMLYLSIYNIPINAYFDEFSRYKFSNIEEIETFLNRKSSILYLDKIYEEFKDKTRLEIKFFFLFKDN